MLLFNFYLLEVLITPFSLRQPLAQPLLSIVAWPADFTINFVDFVLPLLLVELLEFFYPFLFIILFFFTS